jgi:hypothetical protein
MDRHRDVGGALRDVAARGDAGTHGRRVRAHEERAGELALSVRPRAARIALER